MRTRSSRVVDRQVESAVALAQQYRDTSKTVPGGHQTLVGHRQVRLAVAVEVTHRDRYGRSSRVQRANRREGLGTTVSQRGLVVKKIGENGRHTDDGGNARALHQGRT